MVRTVGDKCARKVVAAKAPRKNLGAASSTVMKAGNSKSPAGKKGKYGGGNPICPRATPDWQKEITNFLVRPPTCTTKQKENVNPEEEATSGAGCSKEDRTKAAQGCSSSACSSRMEDDTDQVMEEEQQDEEHQEEEHQDREHQEEEHEEKDEEKDDDVEETETSSSATASKRKFKKNNCISDSEDDE